MGTEEDAGLIDALFDASAHSNHWPAAITLLADRLGAHGGMLVRNAETPDGSSCIVGRISPDIAATYVRDYTNNPWTAAAVVPVGRVAVLSQLYDLRNGRTCSGTPTSCIPHAPWTWHTSRCRASPRMTVSAALPCASPYRGTQQRPLPRGE